MSGLPRQVQRYRARELAIGDTHRVRARAHNSVTTTPKVLFDFEFHFANGDQLFLSAEEGRDRIAADEARVRLELRPDQTTTEEIIVSRSALAYMRTTRRELKAELPAEFGLTEDHPAMKAM